MTVLDSSIGSFIKELVDNYSNIKEIWWIGSRANNQNVRHDSDWDFLIFAEESTHSQIYANKSLEKISKELFIDLLVENEAGVFDTVWGPSKTLRLKEDLKWKIISETKAQYYGTKLIKREPAEQVFQDKLERYFSEHGADVTSEDGSAWMYAFKIWPQT